MTLVVLIPSQVMVLDIMNDFRSFWRLVSELSCVLCQAEEVLQAGQSAVSMEDVM